MEVPKRKEVVFVIGGPGSGKGTHVRKLFAVRTNITARSRYWLCLGGAVLKPDLRYWCVKASNSLSINIFRCPPNFCVKMSLPSLGSVIECVLLPVKLTSIGLHIQHLTPYWRMLLLSPQRATNWRNPYFGCSRRARPAMMRVALEQAILMHI